MGLWDFFGGFGESLTDWGGSQGMYGLGSINPAAGESFKSLDLGSFPGPIQSSFSAFHDIDRSVPNLSEGWYQGALNNNNGYYGDAFRELAAKRWTGGFGDDIPLRNAEHGMFAQDMFNNPTNGMLMNYALPAFSIPMYTGAKAAVQQFPFLNPAVGGLYNMIHGPGAYNKYDLLKATPSSFDEMWWGLRPFWGRN